MLCSSGEIQDLPLPLFISTCAGYESRLPSSVVPYALIATRRREGRARVNETIPVSIVSVCNSDVKLALLCRSLR